jgi:hypothetical protein
LVITCQTCSNIRGERDIAEHNINAALDTILYFKDKYNQEYAEKTSYVSTVKNLKTLNQKLYDKIKNTKQDVVAAGSVETSTNNIIVFDTIINFVEGEITIPIEDDLLKGTLSLGVSNQEEVKLDTFEYNVNVPIDFFFTKENNLIVTSPNKKVHITQMTSFVVPKTTTKKKHWTFGPTLSLGINYGSQIPTSVPKFGYGFQIGLGVTYKLLEW